MDRNIARSLGIAVASLAALISCLIAAEAFNAAWLYFPCIALTFVALLAGDIAVWGIHGILVAFLCLVGVAVLAFFLQQFVATAVHY